MSLASMSLSELAAEYMATKDEFIVPFARIKFGRENWRDALSNAAQPSPQADAAPAEDFATSTATPGRIAA